MDNIAPQSLKLAKILLQLSAATVHDEHGNKMPLGKLVDSVLKSSAAVVVPVRHEDVIMELVNDAFALFVEMEKTTFTWEDTFVTVARYWESKKEAVQNVILPLYVGIFCHDKISKTHFVEVGKNYVVGPVNTLIGSIGFQKELYLVVKEVYDVWQDRHDDKSRERVMLLICMQNMMCAAIQLAGLVQTADEKPLFTIPNNDLGQIITECMKQKMNPNTVYHCRAVDDRLDDTILMEIQAIAPIQTGTSYEVRSSENTQKTELEKPNIRSTAEMRTIAKGGVGVAPRKYESPIGSNPTETFLDSERLRLVCCRVMGTLTLQENFRHQKNSSLSQYHDWFKPFIAAGMYPTPFIETEEIVQEYNPMLPQVLSHRPTRMALPGFIPVASLSFSVLVKYVKFFLAVLNLQEKLTAELKEARPRSEEFIYSHGRAFKTKLDFVENLLTEIKKQLFSTQDIALTAIGRVSSFQHLFSKAEQSKCSPIESIGQSINGIQELQAPFLEFKMGFIREVLIEIEEPRESRKSRQAKKY